MSDPELTENRIKVEDPEWGGRLRELIVERTKAVEALAEFDRQVPSQRERLCSAVDQAIGKITGFAEGHNISEDDAQQYLQASNGESNDG